MGNFNYSDNIPTNGTFTKIDYPIKPTQTADGITTHIKYVQFGQADYFGYDHSGTNGITQQQITNWENALNVINQFLNNINTRLEALENGSSDDPVEPTYYTITWNSTGGSSVSSSQIEAGSMLGNLPTTSKSGYNFNGWYTASSGGSRINESTIPTKDTTYYAHWTAQTTYYTITWNSNGGSSVSSSQIVAGSTLGSLPTTSKSGYDFDGWYTSSGTQISPSTIPSGNTTYYAHWTAQTTYYWYAGQTQPTSMSSNPEVDDTNFTVNKWHTLGDATTIGKTITDGASDLDWYVAVPTEVGLKATAGDLTAPDTSWDNIDTITINSISYTVWRPNITGTRCAVYMAKIN